MTRTKVYQIIKKKIGYDDEDFDAYLAGKTHLELLKISVLPK